MSPLRGGRLQSRSVTVGELNARDSVGRFSLFLLLLLLFRRVDRCHVNHADRALEHQLRVLELQFSPLLLDVVQLVVHAVH